PERPSTARGTPGRCPPLNGGGGRLGEDAAPVMDALIPAPAMEGIHASPWSSVDDGWRGDGRRRRSLGDRTAAGLSRSTAGMC
uniref:Uncharacterized protein n=1 Tax=Triticum urartu TaxID=4572 RepID=A0A8R7QJA3_TRIUA